MWISRGKRINKERKFKTEKLDYGRRVKVSNTMDGRGSKTA